MPRPRQGLERHNVRLTIGAVEALQRYYPAMGYNRAIRLIVDKHLEMLGRLERPKAVPAGTLAEAEEFVAGQIGSPPLEDSREEEPAE